ncbi:MAG: hypothetical protein EXR77_15540 [Myxococcales bacterium]|nr:hypothetical protein [Myxococcales bacterium]
MVSSAYLTWFQAQAACTAAGKRLITNDEWQAAVERTVDPGVNDGSTAAANTKSAATRMTGLCKGTCSSTWGVDDGIGNLNEWMDLWLQAGETGNFSSATPWPAGDRKDITYNVNGKLYNNGVSMVVGGPAAALRGRNHGAGAGAGVFSFDLTSGPAHWSEGNGFRCAARPATAAAAPAKGPGICGVTDAVTGAVGSYKAAKLLCEKAIGFGAAANVCTAGELAIIAQSLDVMPDSVKGARYIGFTDFYWKYDGKDIHSGDCTGFTVGDDKTFSPCMANSTTKEPAFVYCSEMRKFACCNYDRRWHK